MENYRVMLNRPCDWRLWYKTLVTEAVKVGVWEYLDPEGEACLVRPEVPLLPERIKYIPSLEKDGVKAVEAYERSLHHFTNVSMPLYRLRLGHYNKDYDSMLRMEEFFDKTVNKVAYGELCARSGDLRSRISTLQSQLASVRQAEVNDAYWALEEILSKPHVNDDNWSINWSRDLRAALLRCENLQAMNDDQIRRVRSNVADVFIPEGIPRSFGTQKDLRGKKACRLASKGPLVAAAEEVTKPVPLVEPVN